MLALFSLQFIYKKPLLSVSGCGLMTTSKAAMAGSITKQARQRAFSISEGKTMGTIKVKQEQAAKLADSLSKSLAIQSVWPEAFHGGQSCTLKTLVGMKAYPSRQYEVKRAFLVRCDGVEREITLEQYRTLTPAGFDLSQGFKRIVVD